MASPAHPPSVICFGQFELDVASGELRKSGIPLKIHPQPFQVLQLLAGRPKQIVTREEIRTALWGGNTFVDFERGINSCVNQIRATLGDDPEKPRYIETLPRRGYRFIGSLDTGATKAPDLPVERMKNASSPSTVEPAPAIPTSRARIHIPALAVAAVLAVLFGLNIRPVRDRLLGRSSAPPIRALAVLPLENLSADPEQDFLPMG